MWRRHIALVALLQFLCAAAAIADITSASLEIQGAGLRLETVSVTTGLDIPTTIQTSFGNRTNDQSPSVPGLVAVGDLTGPGIEIPIELTTTPGYRFHIPGLTRLGDYYLQNVRLMNGTDVIQRATPSLAKITVADLFQTSLSVKQLTPEEIRARGIVIDERNYDVYDYSLTFLVNGEQVIVPFPVIVDRRTHVITPVREERDYGLPPAVKNAQPPRWTPPEIIPFEFPDLPSDGLSDPGTNPPEREIRPPRPRIPAALVIPNSLAVLHQFFAVVLNVTNGAPTSSTARLEDIRATMKIKVSTALRTVKSTPAVAFGQAVPVVDPNTGVTVLLAQSKGEAEWVLEGLQPGTHTVEVDILATLRETGQRDVQLRATPSAAVIIHDPRFNINFSHPDTIRKGVDYLTFAFITNMSPSTQTIRVSDGLPECAAQQTPNVCRVSGGSPPADMTIPAGEMRVVEYRLRSGVTGQVFATAGSINNDNITAAVQLHLGVSATGIPLSPATLVLPYYAKFVEPSLVSGYLQLLGLGYSLATAPLNQMTARFPRVIKTDVFYRASDIARAGQRIFITNSSPAGKRDALSNLFLDLLGNSIELREWDELRRKETAGRSAGVAVVEQLRDALTAGQSSMSAAVDEFAKETAHRDPYVLAVAHAPNGATRPLSITIRGVSGRTAPLDLAFSEVARFDALDRAGEMVAVGRWTEAIEVFITPLVTGTLELELLYPGTTDGTTMRARVIVSGTADQTLRVPLTRGATTINVLLSNGAIAATTASSAVAPESLTILSARQDLHLDPEGHKVSVLFSRPVAVSDGTDLLTKFSAEIDFNRDGVIFNDSRPIFAAALQQDQRVVNLSFDHVLSTNAGYAIEVEALIDPITAAPVSFPDAVVPAIDNDRPAGILYGKFITGNNTPIPSAEIKFFTGHWVGCNVDEVRAGDEGGIACNPFAEAPQYARTRSDGSFLFEYVPRDVIADSGLTGGYKAVGVTAEGRATAVEGSVRLPGRVHIVNLQLLGRGSAEGKVRYDNGEIARGVRVHISSTMFNVGRDAITDNAGFFRVEDLAVGPITFGAVDDAGNVAFASGEIATPGQIAVKDLVIFRKPFPGTGTVYGRVTRSDTGGPVFGARVGAYSQGYGFAEARTDSDGKFEFTKVPSGFVTLLAAEWSISRENAATDFDLRADETKEVNLTLSVTPSDMSFVRVTGKVVRENPLFPGDATKYERVPGAIVNLAILTTTADADGEFVFDGVPIVAGDAATQKTIRAYDPSTKRIGISPVPTLSGAGPNDVTVFIPANSYGGGTVRVRVVNAHGVAVDGFRVIEPGFPPKNLTRLGPALYEYRDAPIGSLIEIFAVHGPAAYGEQVASGTIRLDFAGQTATLVLRLPGQGTVRTKLRSDLDLIGDVALTYAVWNEQQQEMDGFTVIRSTSDNGVAGFATFTAVPALQQYHVASSHPAYGYAEVRGQLGYDGDVGLHTLQLNKLATVRGTVYAIDGVTPIAGAAVRLHDGRRDPGIMYTQPDGTFVFHDVPAAVSFHVTAEVTQSGIYRVGIAFGRTPDLGGPAPAVPVILRRRGSVEGRVVYAEYKVYDADNPNNRVADDTPADYSDNAPVPLARFWLRELDYPARTFGSNAEPLVADVGGRFAINDVFVGSLRAMGWATGNQEMRGNWSGVLSDEGQRLTGVYIAVGTGGTGSLQVKVVDPDQQYLPIPNAEVRLYRGGLFDLTTTDDAGLARFEQLPAGSYGVDAYSKSLGKSGAGTGFTIQKDQLTDIRILLEFVGKVDGRLTDPMITPARALPGVPVKLTASSFYALASTDASGLFFFEGIREGPFQLAAKDTQSNRWADGQGIITPANRRPFVELQLERTEALHVAVYLPNDTGGNSGILAGHFDVDVRQREADYHRALQGNPLVFPSLFINNRFGGAERYYVSLREIGGAGRALGADGVFPKGSAADPLKIVYPAFGGVEITVIQAGVPAEGARVEIHAPGERRSLFTDSSGRTSATGLPLGGVLVQATSVDGRFTGSSSVTIARQSVPATAAIELGAYAGIAGLVEAEAGGPSIGTRVVASFAGRTLEMLTDNSGRYVFQGIPTSAGGTLVSISYVGPDGVTIGARQSVSLNHDWASRVRTLATVKLDATPPQLLAIIPADNSQNVSPDAPIHFTFSEVLESADLSSANLQLVAVDGSGQVAATIESAAQVGGTFTVTLRPNPRAGERFPLSSNTLYRIVVQAALRDLTGHRLPAPRGSTFTTSDYAEPRVLKLVPSTTLPLPAQVTLQFHFNEPVDPQIGSFRFYKIAAPGPGGAILSEKAGRAYIDPATGLYLAFAPNGEIEPESFYRAVFTGVRDMQGNALGTQTFHYFSFDNTKPYLRLISPVPDGTSLVSGVEYTLNIDPRHDSLDGPVASDVASVEYVRVDGATETFLTTATATPFSYRFVGPEAPEAGIAYTIRAKATDLSGNAGPPSTISWTVKPNAAPKNVAMTVAPSPAYPGTTVTANVTFEDEGVLAPVQVVLRGTNNDGTEFVKSEGLEAKRSTVAQPWAPVALRFNLPATLKPDAAAIFTVTVTDVRGLSGTTTTNLSLLSDTVKPVIVSTSPAPETNYTLNAKYRVTAVVSDAETGVAEVAFVIDGTTHRVFAASSTAGPTADSRTFSSPQITATARNVDTRIPIVIRVIDHHGNATVRSYDVIYVGVNDPTAPKATWLCPIDRAVVPASQVAFRLPLKVRAQDDVSVTSVNFRVTGIANPLAATRIGATDDYEATAIFDTPAAAADLVVTAIVTDADASHTIEVPITIDIVAVDRVIDATEAVDADTVQLYEGKSLVVRGAGKLVANVPVSLRNLLVLDGGRVETLGTTLTRERKMDITVLDRAYVDCTATVDVTARGYLGGWGVNPDGSGTRSDTAVGRTTGNTVTGGATHAAGSHAGLGGTLVDGSTNVPYGSITTPLDLGSGGAGHRTDTERAGGTGGGAVSLRTSKSAEAIARIVVAGTIRADAGQGGRHGGSGGSIRVDARQIVIGPLAHISANGGTGSTNCVNGPEQCGGGSGGRIAVTATERLDIPSPLDQLRAAGGLTGPGGSILHGAAGTVFLRRPGQTDGELYVANATGYTRSTPFGDVTFDRIVLGRNALARFDSRFTVGGAVEDGSKIEKDPTAVLVTRGVLPNVIGTTTPVSGSNLIRNTPVDVVLDVAATGGGVLSAELDFSAVPPKRVLTFGGYPLIVDDHRTSIAVPHDAPLGTSTLKAKITDRADRVFDTTIATFTIIDNTAPVITTFTTVPSSLYPGSSFTATLGATDDVKITKISVTAQIGTDAPSTQTRTPNVIAISNESFTFAVPVTTPGGTGMTVDASVEDGFPARLPTKQLNNITILHDTIAPQATITAPSHDQLFEEAVAQFAIDVNASDAEVRVRTVRAQVATEKVVELTPDAAATRWQGTLTFPGVDGEDIVSYPVTVIATDYAGNATTRTINIRVKPTIDPNAPVVSWLCGRDGKAVNGVPTKLRINAIAANTSNPVQKVEFLIDGQSPLPASNTSGNIWEATWNMPALAAGTVTQVTAVATASGNASTSSKSSVTAVVADQIFSADATIAATNLTYENKIVVVSGGTLTISGGHTFADLLILGGTVTHPAGDTSLRLNTDLYVACAGTIDLTARGFAANATYLGATPGGSGNGGSHLGVGGVNAGPPGTAFGSIYQPREAGGGGTPYSGTPTAGGGVVSIVARTVTADGAIRANGGSGGRPTGAGGSVWIRTARISGTGTIEANGGTPSDYGSGGGGAVAVEYSDATSVIPLVRATSAAAPRIGGAGTVYVKGPSSVYGDLTIDNGSVAGQVTELPSLGSGTAQPGTNGTTLITDRTTDVPGYFVGHWVEIPGKGTWRIREVSGKTVSLDAQANVSAGDAWRGVYLFDTIRLGQSARLSSNDAVRAARIEVTGANIELVTAIQGTSTTIRGTVSASEITATDLTIETGAVLTQSGSALRVNATSLVVRGAIDVTNRGYPAGATHSGATAGGAGNGGSHLGVGGVERAPVGSSFGSIYQPQEAGAGGIVYSGIPTAGGGVVSIAAGTVIIDGAIRANGGSGGRPSGAGGSVWIRTGRISGTGTIEANGGAPSDYGGGGGGAVAIEYTDAASVLPVLRAFASAAQRVGGAGTVFIKGPASTYGNLIVDNGGQAGQITSLPSLGHGIAQPGTSGTTLITDRATNIPSYFVGHSIEIAGKGTWKVAAVDGKTAALETGANVAAGDHWQGVYRVDLFKLRGSSLHSADPIRYASLDKDAASSIVMNASAPQLAEAQIAMNGDVVTGSAGAVMDPDVPIKLTTTNARTAQSWTANAAGDGSFSIPVGGVPGDTFTLRAADSHTYPFTSRVIPVSGALVETTAIASLTLDPPTLPAGSSCIGSIRLSRAARPGGVTISLASSDTAAVVPASITIPGGASTAQFAISTNAVAIYTRAVITATLANSTTAPLTIAPATSALTALTLTPPTVQGGASANATAVLGGLAPPGGALINVASDSRSAIVPPSVVVPEGSTEVTFTVTTSQVATASNARVSATYGATKSATLALSACATMTSVAPLPSIGLTTTWVDDAGPAGATPTGNATFDNTQSASGTLALHFAASAASRNWSFAGAVPLTVAASDNLVVHALINPCNPPRQIVIAWGDGTSEWRGSWGENRITATAATYAGAVPTGGTWTRVAVPAAALGIATTVNLTRLAITVDGGEVWFDAIGNASCAVPRQPAPSYLVNETVWFDDTLPAGAVVTRAFNPDATQVASGTISDLIAKANGIHDHSFHSATSGLPLTNDDVIVAYVFIDPCYPPRSIGMQFNDGATWNRGVYWGENLVNYGAAYRDPLISDLWGLDRRRIGAIPMAGQWIRLEVPVSSMQMTGMTLRGFTVTLYDGQAWLDRVGKAARVNLALGKSATQSSGPADPCPTSDCPGKAVDGDVLTYQQTNSQPEAWWQVDLGSVQAIESIDVWNGGLNLCCQERLTKFWVLVSDEPFASTGLAAARSQAGVTSYYNITNGARPSGFDISRKGRYVRVQLSGTNYLHAAEVQVWAPLSASPVNLAGGRSATSSSIAPSSYGTLIPELAVNGGSIGVSFSHTENDAGAWWQVDLGSVQWISTIDLDNTSPCCGSRMANFYLFVSDTPFASNAVVDVVGQPGVSAYYRGAWSSSYAYAVNRTGRYVRIQLTGTNYLHPFEVKVWSPFLTLPPLAKAVDIK